MFHYLFMDKYEVNPIKMISNVAYENRCRHLWNRRVPVDFECKYSGRKRMNNDANDEHANENEIIQLFL